MRATHTQKCELCTVCVVWLKCPFNESNFKLRMIHQIGRFQPIIRLPSLPRCCTCAMRIRPRQTAPDTTNLAEYQPNAVGFISHEGVPDPPISARTGHGPLPGNVGHPGLVGDRGPAAWARTRRFGDFPAVSARCREKLIPVFRSIIFKSLCCNFGSGA